MSCCTFIASDAPLREAAPSQSYPLVLDLDMGSVEDGGADDNYFLTAFSDVGFYTDRRYAVSLEWNATAGRAERLVTYIREALRETDAVELWHVWLGEFFEFEDRPFLHRQTVSANDLTAEHIRQIDQAEIWNRPDKRCPSRPSFYCLTVTR
ncbi:MAG: hypothetical protein E7655_09015 [Ruminococcaceae bacterium]|nr:hypothetical protein [Oscillospiraceae bacterium]